MEKKKKNLSVVRRKNLEERNEMIYIQSIIYRIQTKVLETVSLDGHFILQFVGILFAVGREWGLLILNLFLRKATDYMVGVFLVPTDRSICLFCQCLLRRLVSSPALSHTLPALLWNTFTSLLHTSLITHRPLSVRHVVTLIGAFGAHE